MTTITMPKTKVMVVEEPLALHTYATKCWQGVRLSDIFRLKLDRERNDWRQYISRFNGSSAASDK